MDSFRLLCLIPLFLGLSTQALNQKTKILKNDAFFIQNSTNGLFESLDLKQKKISYSKDDIGDCEKRMIRHKDTLHYTCTMPLPGVALISKRHNQVTPVIMTILYANQNRKVFITVSDDAKYVTYSTEFDAVGFDLEVAQFNDDFYNVYGKTAVNVIGEAMKKSLQYEVLESRDKQLAQAR